MKQLEDVNQFENYVIHQKRADKILFYALIGFILMGLAIVYYATKNKKLKDDNIELSKHIKELEDQRQKYLQEKIIALDSVENQYDIQLDSINTRINTIVSIKDSSLNFLQNQYTTLLKYVKVANAAPSRVVRSIESTNREKVVSKMNEVKEKTTKVLKQTKDYKEMKKNSSRFSIYIQYMAQNETLAKRYYNGGLRNTSYKLNKPELITYEFPSIVKYFHDEDMATAQAIANYIHLDVKKELSKYTVPKGQIEVWLGSN